MTARNCLLIADPGSFRAGYFNTAAACHRSTVCDGTAACTAAAMTRIANATSFIVWGVSSHYDPITGAETSCMTRPPGQYRKSRFVLAADGAARRYFSFA